VGERFRVLLEDDMVKMCLMCLERVADNNIRRWKSKRVLLLGEKKGRRVEWERNGG